jgi:hypothetical protein
MLKVELQTVVVIFQIHGSLRLSLIKSMVYGWQSTLKVINIQPSEVLRCFKCLQI